MKPEELLNSLVSGEITPSEFKERAQELELPAHPKSPPWMEEAGAKPRPPYGPATPLERLPWENLPAWMDEC